MRKVVSDFWWLNLGKAHTPRWHPANIQSIPHEILQEKKEKREVGISSGIASDTDSLTSPIERPKRIWGPISSLRASSSPPSAWGGEVRGGRWQRRLGVSDSEIPHLHCTARHLLRSRHFSSTSGVLVQICCETRSLASTREASTRTHLTVATC